MITVFVGFLLVVLGVNHAIFLPIVWLLVITSLGATAGLVTAGCGEELHFKGICWVFFLT